MKQTTFAKLVRTIACLHYDVRTSGLDLLKSGQTYLLMPNHVAFVDPVLVGAYTWWTRLRPMSTAYLFKNKIAAWVLHTCDAIEVPEMDGTTDLRVALQQANQLRNIALDNLREGRSILVYPSGHVKHSMKEDLGNKRLGYELCKELPEGVRIILLRTKGLEGSCTSRLPWKFALRRHVTMTFEDHTEELTQLAKSTDRRSFNENLESWYNE